MSMVTVWRSVSAAQSAIDRQENNRVEVTTRKPAEKGFMFELHIPEDQLEATDREDVFLVDWGLIDQYPYQSTQ